MELVQKEYAIDWFLRHSPIDHPYPVDVPQKLADILEFNTLNAIHALITPRIGVLGLLTKNCISLGAKCPDKLSHYF